MSGSYSAEHAWYVDTYFQYTNALMERAEKRANYLLISNSIALAGLLSILPVVTDQPADGYADAWNLLLAVPAIAFFASITLSVLVFFPKTLDYAIPINHERVAKLTQAEFRAFVSDRTSSAMIRDYVDECHILSRILDQKVTWVRRSAKAFLVGAVVVLPIGAFLLVAALL